MKFPGPLKLVLFLGPMLLSGCMGLGIGVLGNNERSVSNPHIEIEKGKVGRTEGTVPWMTSNDLLRYWGDPDSIERTAPGDEEWQYNFGRRWNGVGILVAFVPLPLLIPVGHEYILFTIRKGQVVKAQTKEDDWIAMYGCVMSAIVHAGGAGCEFGRLGKETRFVGDVHLFKIRVINATNDVVTVTRTDRAYISRVAPPFTLKPRESRNVFDFFWVRSQSRMPRARHSLMRGRSRPRLSCSMQRLRI